MKTRTLFLKIHSRFFRGEKIYFFHHFFPGGDNKKLYFHSRHFGRENKKLFIFTPVLEKEGEYILSNDW